ncbi:MAG: RagB/SusD family nutrient uptake outer membrane protein [Pedobacter sp.]|nr:MAG: RagB/SusD family nutrient uptake outer membrane protein [Pedobacter sp.]
MKKINIFLLGLLIIGLSSCKKFLDVKPSNSGDSDLAIQTPADAQVMINGIMRTMSSADYYGRNFMLYADAKGGDFTIFSQGRGQDGLYTFNHQVTSGSNVGFWSQIYYGILQANNLLENIAKLEATGATGFNSAKGQALTARAIMYFDLVRLYGKSYDDDKTSFGVPIVLTKLTSDAQPLRSTVEQTYTQILKDLKDAAPLLPKTKTNGYINYYGNLATQARVYLTMKDNVNALSAAQEVIGATSLYSLYSNANWVTSWTTQFGSESIFEIGIVPLENDLTTGSLGFYHRRRSHGATTALGWFTASSYFLTRLGQDANDVRWGVMAYDETAGNTRLGAIYKYSGSTTLAGDGKATPTAVNLKLIRLSEMHLIAAEAILPTNPGQAAIYLNNIRRRSPNLAPATAATVSVDMILDERSKEFIGEGQRFFDMIRLNKPITFNDELGAIPASFRTKTIDRTFFRTRLPISQTEINANPGIGAQQNPGY